MDGNGLEVLKFSREFSSLKALNGSFTGTKRRNSRENLMVCGTLFAVIKV